MRLAPLIEESDIGGHVVPSAVTEDVRGRAVEGRVLELWEKSGIPDTPASQPLVAAAAAVGVVGAGVATLCKRLRWSRAKLFRKFDEACLPGPGALLAEARLMSVDVRVDLGMGLAEACRAAGWFSARAYEKAKRRARRHGTDRGVG